METFVFHLMPYRDITDEAWPFPDDSWDPDVGAGYYAEYLDQLELAAELGYDGLGFNEHHFSGYGLQPSPIVTASYLAARTDEITLGFFGNVLPIRRNPIRLAEEIAMLDNISEGRVLSGFARGIPAEYLAYNVPQEESRSLMSEAWDLVMETWTADEPFDWDGEHFQFEDVYAWPRPYQDPHPPLWMPAVSEPSLRFAAERQLTIGTAGPTAEAIADTFDTYRTIAEDDYGWSPGPDAFSVLEPVYVAESMERAKEEAREHLRFLQHRLFAGIHLGEVVRMSDDDGYRPEHREQYVEDLPPQAKSALEWTLEDAIESGRALVGDPEFVAAEIERQQEVIGGFGTLVGQFQFGSLPPDLAKKNLRLFADEVLPYV